MRVSHREWTVLVAAAYGATIEETAHRLGLSVQTVKNARYECMHRHGAATMPDLFRRLGWLRVPAETVIPEGRRTAAGLHLRIYP